MGLDRPKIAGFMHREHLLMIGRKPLWLAKLTASVRTFQVLGGGFQQMLEPDGVPDS